MVNEDGPNFRCEFCPALLETVKRTHLNVSTALNESLDNVLVAELDGAHQRGVVTPVSHMNTSSILIIKES